MQPYVTFFAPAQIRLPTIGSQVFSQQQSQDTYRHTDKLYCRDIYSVSLSVCAMGPRRCAGEDCIHILVIRCRPHFRGPKRKSNLIARTGKIIINETGRKIKPFRSSAFLILKMDTYTAGTPTDCRSLYYCALSTISIVFAAWRWAWVVTWA